jgi:Tfp pilus assembly protein PilO
VQVRTKNLAVVALASFLVLFMWYRFIYSPMNSQAAKANDRKDTAETRAEALRKELAGATAQQKKIEEIKPETLTAAIPVDDKLTTFLRDLDRIKAESGAAFQSVTPSQPTVSGVVSTINVNIAVAGTYDEVSGYVSRILSMPRLFVVDNVSYTAGGSASGSTATGGPTGKIFAGSGSAPLIQVQITGRMYSQPSAAAAATANASAPAPPAQSSPGAAAPTP